MELLNKYKRKINRKFVPGSKARRYCDLAVLPRQVTRHFSPLRFSAVQNRLHFKFDFLPFLSIIYSKQQNYVAVYYRFCTIRNPDLYA